MVARGLTTHVASSQAAQIVIDDGDQIVECLATSFAPGNQQLCDLNGGIGVIGHAEGVLPLSARYRIGGGWRGFQTPFGEKTCRLCHRRRLCYWLRSRSSSAVCTVPMGKDAAC